MTRLALLGTLAGALLSPLWLVLQIRALRDWRGVWRLLAVVPVGAVAAHVLVIAVGIARDRTAHNLWPLELGKTVGPALAFLGLVALLRWRRRRGAGARAV